MRDLTEEELNELVSDKVADYENEISLFVPLTSDQPVIMYTSKLNSMPSKHYLSSNIKRKYTSGLYVYSPKKPFDISEHEFIDKWVRCAKLVDDGDYLRINISNESFNTVIHNKQDAIAIAKALGVTGEDLLS
jgi:hypothetical protein